MKISGLWDSIGNNRLCGREDCQHCGNCSGEPIQVLPVVHCTQQVESGNPGESKELRNAREKFNRVFGVSLGEEDRLVHRLGMLELQISYLYQVSYYSCTCWQGRVPAQGYIYLTVTGTSRFILPSIFEHLNSVMVQSSINICLFRWLTLLSTPSCLVSKQRYFSTIFVSTRYHALLT